MLKLPTAASLHTTSSASHTIILHCKSLITGDFSTVSVRKFIYEVFKKVKNLLLVVSISSVSSTGKTHEYFDYLQTLYQGYVSYRVQRSDECH